jgi:oxygen-dependent protoporphyrinogen oxidase
MRVVVIGGGVSGLAAAQRLRELGGDELDLVLLERSDRLGGKIQTGRLASRAVETGAETFLVREFGAESAVLDLARRVGLADQLIHPAAVPAAIAVDGQLRPVPAGTMLGVPAKPSTMDGFAAVAEKDVDSGQPILEPGQDIGVGELVRARYGDEIVDRLVDPMLGGVYAGRADLLSLATTMPGLYETAQRENTLTGAVTAAMAAAPRPTGQPIFASVHGGLSTLVNAVAASARPAVQLNATVRGLTRTGAGWTITVGSTRDAELVEADAVVLAVPAAPAARLLDNSDIAALDYASVALVTLALPPGTQLPHLSGFLVPATEGFGVKAATFFSTKWGQDSSGPVMVRTSLGRYGEEAVLQRPDADLIALARKELSELIAGSIPEPLDSSVQRWGGGLPQYGVGHLDRVARARAGLAPRLALAGAAYDGVGIAACVRSGQAAADTLWVHMGE